MDAAQALADLTEISSQIEVAVLFEEDGGIAGSTLVDDGRSRALVTAAAELLDAADAVRSGVGTLTQLEASTHEGSVFVVREGPRRIVATTAADPTVGLVFYDLKSCLRGLGDGELEKPKRAPRRRRKEEDGDAT